MSRNERCHGNDAGAKIAIKRQDVIAATRVAEQTCERENDGVPEGVTEHIVHLCKECAKKGETA